MKEIILFDGSSFNGWRSIGGGAVNWELADGCMTVKPGSGNIVSEEVYGDAYIHLEWMEPDMPGASGQSKGNSGVYIQGRYEIQVLDSYGVKNPDKGDCGAIYAVSAPLTNACKPALEWQCYDIIFRAPRFDAEGKKTENARITILQNGIPVQNNLELPSFTGGPLEANETAEGPLMLQDHGDRVKFRNIRLYKF
ncbi:MAG: DUF1080 domain-containing protein [Clostridiales bacterium]|nr:DUF1080 domain-containing protein [Clostridiales bacterium]